MSLHRYLLPNLLVGVVLTACGSPTTPPVAESPTTPTAPTTGSTATTSGDTKAQFTGMQTVITNTTAAVNTGDFAKARETFEGFETYWEKVEDGVKAKSAEAYKAIEDDMDTVSIGLKATNPDKARVLTALQSLSKKLANYASTLP
jgi:hypothetical protein